MTRRGIGTSGAPTVLAGLLVVLAWVATASAQAPVLTVQEPDLGTWEFQGITDDLVELEVSEYEPLDFSWSAEPDGSASAIVSYRYGWDLVDPDDPNDPSWATPPDPDVLFAPTRTFSVGAHTLHVETVDDLGSKTRGGFALAVVPPVPAETSTWSGVKAVLAR